MLRHVTHAALPAGEQLDDRHSALIGESLYHGKTVHALKGSQTLL